MRHFIFLISLFLLFSCKEEDGKSDAFGNFESDEILISAENSGKLMEFKLEEGIEINKGEYVGCIDTVQLHLRKMQLLAAREAVRSKFSSVIAQVNVIESQLESANKDKDRFQRMFEKGAATEKQMDDINFRIDVLKEQIEQIKTQNSTIFSELDSFNAQIRQVEDLISRSKIINPIKGTVLEKYAEENELVNTGRSLYKIAKLDKIYLKVYLSGSQLANIKLGQKVKVFSDKDKEKNKEFKGEVSWISSVAEFTPKTIQTKEERVNLVYAVKVRVKNDGTLKIGMPGEVVL